MILDAGCGNRCMWKIKESENIIYVDVEKKLHVKPKIFTSITNLPFNDSIFSCVIFDPPFSWGNSTHPFFSFPNVNMRNEMYPDMALNDGRVSTTYYGIERYTSRSQIVSYIYKAEKELYRVLKRDGCLWLRWCNMNTLNERNVIGVFQNWHHMLTHEIYSSMRHTGGTKSYWFMLMKKPLDHKQTTF